MTPKEWAAGQVTVELAAAKSEEIPNRVAWHEGVAAGIAAAARTRDAARLLLGGYRHRGSPLLRFAEGVDSGGAMFRGVDDYASGRVPAPKAAAAVPDEWAAGDPPD